MLLLLCWIPESPTMGAWTAGKSLGMRCARLGLVAAGTGS